MQLLYIGWYRLLAYTLVHPIIGISATFRREYYNLHRNGIKKFSKLHWKLLPYMYYNLYNLPSSVVIKCKSQLINQSSITGNSAWEISKYDLKSIISCRLYRHIRRVTPTWWGRCWRRAEGSGRSGDTSVQRSVAERPWPETPPPEHQTGS